MKLIRLRFDAHGRHGVHPCSASVGSFADCARTTNLWVCSPETLRLRQRCTPSQRQIVRFIASVSYKRSLRHSTAVNSCWQLTRRGQRISSNGTLEDPHRSPTEDTIIFLTLYRDSQEALAADLPRRHMRHVASMTCDRALCLPRRRGRKLQGEPPSASQRKVISNLPTAHFVVPPAGGVDCG